MYKRTLQNCMVAQTLLWGALIFCASPRMATAQGATSPALDGTATNSSDPKIQLLYKMLRPSADYEGEEVTEVTEYGGRTSHQKVYGNTKGEIRREYLTPDSLMGDIMIIAPSRYFYYHHGTNVLDVSYWPNEESGRLRRLLKMVKQGNVHVEHVGNERIAGRDAAILAITSKQANQIARQIKFWIGTEKGILLKHEISNAKGLVSRTYFTKITVGSGAYLQPRLFQAPSFPKMVPNPLLPPHPQFHTLEEAQGKIPFNPILPLNIPKGYHITGIWGVAPAQTGRQHPAIILRFGDGVESFTLFQRFHPEPFKPMLDRKKRPFRRGNSVLHWTVPVGKGMVISTTYIGHLPPEQAEALATSVR